MPPTRGTDGGKKVLWRTRCPGSTARRIPCLPRATLGAPRRAGRRTMPEPKTLMGKCVAAVEALAEPEGASRVSIKKVRAREAARHCHGVQRHAGRRRTRRRGILFAPEDALDYMGCHPRGTRGRPRSHAGRGGASLPVLAESVYARR